MKKLALTTIAAISIASGAFAQGFVAWSASPAGSLIGQTNATTYSSLSASLGNGQAAGGVTGNTAGGGSVGNTFYYALMINTTGSQTTAPTTLAGLSSWTYTGLAMTNGASNNGRLNPISPATGSVPYSGSGNENFMLVGWSANIVNSTNVGAVFTDLNTWSTVGGTITGNAFFGVSAVGTLAPSTSNLSPTGLFGANPGQINNPSSAAMQLYLLSVAPTPEPGTMALAALGGASLLLFRRRK